MSQLRIASSLFVLALAGGCTEECQQESRALGFDEPGPWDESPAEVFSFVEDPVVGTLTWVGPVQAGELDPAQAETEVTVGVTLDPNSARMTQTKIGVCHGSLEIDATLTLTTADGTLDESMPIVLEIERQVPDEVTVWIDLTGYDFAGSLELSPGWLEYELQFMLTWHEGVPLTGVMLTGPPLEGESLGEDSDTRGFYAIIEGP